MAQSTNYKKEGIKKTSQIRIIPWWLGNWLTLRERRKNLEIPNSALEIWTLMSLRDPHGNELRIITKKETSFETTEAWNMEIVLLFVFCSCSIQQKKKKN